MGADRLVETHQVPGSIAGLRDQGKTVFMSTHILSDIEALCDEVAILRNGKLAASGSLNDLLSTSGESRILEISVQGVASDAIREQIDFIAGATLKAKPNGAVIQVLDETDNEAVLQITRTPGGRLASIQPLKQSLEELFVKETAL